MSNEWTDEQRLALKPKNDPPHPCKRCRLVIFWCFYPPENKEMYVNDAIDNNMAYFGWPHLCFPCEWGCGRILWFRPATPLRPRRKVDADGEHIKEHWCVNRRIFENKMTPILAEKLAKDGTTREQELAMIEPEIERIAQEEADRKIRVGTQPTQEQVDKEVESIAMTGKLPPTVESNPIFGVLKEEKKKAEFKTADKLLDKEVMQRNETTLYEDITSHNKLTGEAIDSLTKKVLGTIARVEQLESQDLSAGQMERLDNMEARLRNTETNLTSLTTSLHTIEQWHHKLNSKVDKIEDHLARIMQWIGAVQAGVNSYPVRSQP